MSAVYSSGLAAVVWALWLNKEPSIFLDSILIFMIGFLVFGPQMLIGWHWIWDSGEEKPAQTGDDVEFELTIC